MDIICPGCGRRCCNCSGCNPVFINNTWICPNCISKFNKQQVHNTPVMKSQQQAGNWQVLTQHMHKR